MSKPDRPPPLWKTLGWVSWVAVCLIILAGTAIWLSDSKDVDRAGVVLGAVVAALAALFAFLQLDAAKRQLWKAEDEARAQASRGDEQLEQARELVRQTKDALDTARRQYELARKIAETQAVFSVDAALGLYEDVRERLTPSGAPAPERLRLRYYMAVFERLGVLIDQGTVSPETANKFYGSRFKALVNDQGAVDIVTGDREGWVSFLSLWRALKTDRGLRDPDHL